MKRYAGYIPYIVFTIALLSTLISLYFSEIMHLPPCTLCWYQRIAMYPLIAISAVSIMRKDGALAWYGLPFSIAGLLLAAYHNLLYYRVIPEAVTPCTTGVPCTGKLVQLFGFMDIPLMSLITFAFLTLFMVIYAILVAKSTKNDKKV